MFLAENRKVKASNKQLEMQFEAQTRNLAYLEDRLAANLTDHEERVIELKSEIILLKQKTQTYKNKLKSNIDDLKREVAMGEVDSCFKEK